MKLVCPECKAEKRKIGMAGHMMLSHRYSVQQANETVKRLENLSK